MGVSTTGMMAPTLAPALPTLQESSSSSSVAAALASGSNMPTFANAEVQLVGSGRVSVLLYCYSVLAYDYRVAIPTVSLST